MQEINGDMQRATRGLAKSRTVGAACFNRIRKERAGMTNILLIIAILLLVDIYGQLKKLNERQGKEDAGNND